MIMNDKVLGIIIDNNLTWSQHVDKVCKKITINLWLLSRIKDYLTTPKEFNYIKHTFSPTSIIVILYGGGNISSKFK